MRRFRLEGRESGGCWIIAKDDESIRKFVPNRQLAWKICNALNVGSLSEAIRYTYTKSQCARKSTARSYLGVYHWLKEMKDVAIHA